MTCMAVGKSRRLVIDVDDIALKRRLYAALAEDGRSLKDWFLSAASEYLDERINGQQLEFGALRAAEEPAAYGTPEKERKTS